MMYVAVRFVDRLIATSTSVHQSMPFQWDFRLVVGCVSGMLGDSSSEVQYETQRLRHRHASVGEPCLVGMSCCSAHCPRCDRCFKPNKGSLMHQCAEVTQVASRTTASDRSSFQFKCENCSRCFRRARNLVRVQPYCPSPSPSSSSLSPPPLYRRHANV